MKLKTFLTDVLKQCALDKIEVLSVKPTEDGVVSVKSFDEDRMLIIDALTKEPVEDIEGHFGLANFRMLGGLLKSPAFLDDGATARLGTRTIAEETVPDRIEFKGRGSKATFRLINKEVIPAQPQIVNIPWNLSFEPSSEKEVEFKHLAGLYAEVDGNFTLRTEKGNLVADFGIDSSSSHSGSMILSEGVGDDLPGELQFSMDKFLMMLKASAGAETRMVRVTSRGLLGVVFETHAATYNYYLKKKMS